MDQKNAYPSEKFGAARRALMLPHPRGDSESIAGAFHEISLGLHDLDRDDLDDNARNWVRTIEDLMNTSGLTDPEKVGLWTVKARALSVEDKLNLSRCVDELACWFDRRFWSDH